MNPFFEDDTRRPATFHTSTRITDRVYDASYMSSRGRASRSMAVQLDLESTVVLLTVVIEEVSPSWE